MNIKSGIVESIYPPNKTNVLWVHKGILKHFRNGKWESISQGETGTTELEEKVDSLDKEMGEVKNDLIKFGSTQGVVELQIGNSEAIKASNLKILQSIQSTDHTFFTDIDYGYGTGQWLPATYLYKATDEASGNEVWQSFIMDDDKGTFYFKALIQEGKLIIYSVPTVSAATATKAGVVKQISAPATLGTSAELAQVIARLNGVITALISSGVFKGS